MDSQHILPTPSSRREGGWVIVSAFAAALLMLCFIMPVDVDLLLALTPTILVAGIGYCGDQGYVVSTRWRFAAQVFLALLVLGFLHGFPLLWLPIPIDWMLKRSMIDLGWLGYPVGVLMLVWMLNLFDFIDEGDASGVVSESVFVSAALAGYIYYMDQFLFAVAMSFAVTLVGFSLWNWRKATIFIGDAGRGFLGLLLGILLLMASQQAAILLYCGLILSGLFIVVAMYALLYRSLCKRKSDSADCLPTYQVAIRRYGRFNVLKTSWMINLFWLWPISLLVFLYPRYALLGLVIAYLPLLYLVHAKLGRQNRRMA